LLIRNKLKIFLTKSSSLGVSQENKNKVNGNIVVFKKNDMKFLTKIALIFPVNVYLFSHYVNA
jgi:hypothetical protein